jgi:hypothetical protein
MQRDSVAMWGARRAEMFYRTVSLLRFSVSQKGAIVRSMNAASSLRQNDCDFTTRMGTAHAGEPLGRSVRATGFLIKLREAPIRTLSVSLVAVAAIAASLLLTRSRDEEDTIRVVPAGEQQPARLQLDAIRAAGL